VKTLLLGSLARFVLKSVMIPFIATLMVAILLLTIDQMLRLFDFVVNENGSITLVWLMLVNLLPEYVAQALPIGFFMGILLAFRRLALNSEIDVLFAGGASLKQLMAPIFMLSAFLCAADIVIEGYVQPKAYYRYKELGYEVRQRLFDAKLHPGQFMKLSDQNVLRFGQLDASGRKGTEVFFRSCPDDGKCLVASARQGVFIPGDTPSQLTLRMENGRQLAYLLNDQTPVYLGFETLKLPIRLPEIAAFRERGSIAEEKTTLELLEKLRDPDTRVNDPDYADMRANFHFRMMNALAFFWLPFLAIALGITRKRNESFGGLVIGMGMLVTYIEVSQAMAVRAELGEISPWSGIWVVFAVCSVGSMLMFFFVSERPGGVAFTGLRNVMGSVVEFVTSLVQPLVRRFR
jgi:lipopolysaccharide export system permease protein